MLSNIAETNDQLVNLVTFLTDILLGIEMSRKNIRPCQQSYLTIKIYESRNGDIGLWMFKKTLSFIFFVHDAHIINIYSFIKYVLHKMLCTCIEQKQI